MLLSYLMMLNVVVVGFRTVDEKLDLNVYGEKFGIGASDEQFFWC